MFIQYLKSKWKSLLTFFICIGVYSLVSNLHGLSIGACVYACAVCMFFGGVLLLYGYYRYVQKVRALQDIKLRIEHDMVNLPKSVDNCESEYQEIIENLSRKVAEITSFSDSKKSDMIDYYTMWVHQIKTPIAAMGLILQTGDFEEASELKMELFKIEQYVEMVLQYLRLGSEQTDFLFKKYDLDAIIKEVVRKYSVTFIKKKLSLEYVPVNQQVLTDEKWLSYVIEQVLSNALKYTATGKVAIYMDGDTPNTLVIEDTGIGIQEEDLPRVFDRGYTGYNGRTDKKSTGIGLYLCNSILKKMGHSMSIESKVGVGTKVKINLQRKNMKFE